MYLFFNGGKRGGGDNFSCHLCNMNASLFQVNEVILGVNICEVSTKVILVWGKNLLWTER